MTTYTNADTCLVQLIELRDWFRSSGIRTDQGRLARYIRQYEEYVVRPPTTTREDKDYAVAYIYTAKEVAELLWSCNVFRHNPPPGFYDVLQTSLAGHTFTDEDSHKVSARDYLFNIRMAAHFAYAGFSVDFTHEADVVARKDSYTFYIECKRLTSERKIEARAKEARKQLLKRLDAPDVDQKAYGVAAFDVTAVALTRGLLPVAKTANAIRQGIRSQMDAFDNKHNISRHYNPNDKILTTFQQILIVAFCEDGPTHTVIVASSLPTAVSPVIDADASLFRLLTQALCLGAEPSY